MNTGDTLGSARLLAERIGKIVNIGPDTHMMMFGELESLIQAEMDQVSRDFGIKVTSDMHKDLYWQAGEIDRLTRALAQSKKEAYEQGLEVGNAKLKENFKHWTDVAMKEAYEDAADMIVRMSNRKEFLACAEKLREKAGE